MYTVSFCCKTPCLVALIGHISGAVCPTGTLFRVTASLEIIQVHVPLCTVHIIQYMNVCSHSRYLQTRMQVVYN